MGAGLVAGLGSARRGCQSRQQLLAWPPGGEEGSRRWSQSPGAAAGRRTGRRLRALRVWVVARRAWIVPNNIVSVDAFHVTFSVIHQALSPVMV